MKKGLPILLFGLLLLGACSKDDNKDDNNGGNQEPTYDIVELSTDHGTMYIWLYDGTPLHKANFLKLAREGFYDGTTFHRVIKNFMIQGGDPNSKDSDPDNDGQGSPGYTIPAEIDTAKHFRGCLAAARLGNTQNPEKASSGSQFYIALSTSGTAHLNGEYTVFGFVLKGIETADAIVSQPTGSKDRPVTDIKMQMKVLAKTKAQLQTEFSWTPR